jgi:hypothetical protein
MRMLPSCDMKQALTAVQKCDVRLSVLPNARGLELVADRRALRQWTVRTRCKMHRFSAAVHAACQWLILPAFSRHIDRTGSAREGSKHKAHSKVGPLQVHTITG